MKKISLGKTGAKVSQIAFGCLPFGTKLNREQSFQLLDYYISQEGSFLDTSNNYSFWEPGGKGGESESLLGQWFKERKNRKDVFLATKVGAKPLSVEEFMRSNDPDKWTSMTEGLSKKAILKSVDESLYRLQTDYIDLYYAHVDARQDSQEETLEAFDSLVKAGKVLHIGCSNHKVWRMVQAKNISRARGLAEYSAMQMFHTYFQSEKGACTGMADQIGDELQDYVRSNRDITLLGYTPLLWGSYTRKEKYKEIPNLKAFERPQNAERLKRLERVAAETGASINQVIYAWMMASDPIIIPLVAVSKIEHLKEDLESVKLVLSDSQMALLDAPLN